MFLCVSPSRHCPCSYCEGQRVVFLQGAVSVPPQLTCDGRLLVLGALQVLLHQFGCDADDMLPLPVLHHVERLQRADDVTLSDAGHLAGRQQRVSRFWFCWDLSRSDQNGNYLHVNIRLQQTGGHVIVSSLRGVLTF